ncbi:hypothetical protein PIB30_080393 [Stylosanthes scabra]|uniref:Uncharacterized protein n=1 Tax=Stylosanthes scabra TaxID=79078 RepID=A0ABU6TSP6_9FABA|nr:hypothetical protein [Stylosanthes scabra]
MQSIPQQHTPPDLHACKLKRTAKRRRTASEATADELKYGDDDALSGGDVLAVATTTTTPRRAGGFRLLEKRRWRLEWWAAATRGVGRRLEFLFLFDSLSEIQGFEN